MADLTDVGSYTGAASPGGTFDQGGNLWELNEAIIRGSERGVRGGGFFDEASFLAALEQTDSDPSEGDFTVGFRVASPVPESSHLTLQIAAIVSLGLIGLARRRPSATTAIAGADCHRHRPLRS
ncbi:MAG: hypothetical protein JRH19_28440 [Deltaproteobacteria bacterium]|nr:hypothetical protein [Deltaproteobacteria bacterium]